MELQGKFILVQKKMGNPYLIFIDFLLDLYTARKYEE